MLLEASRAHLLLVDMQARILPHMQDAARIERNCHVLLTAARRLGIGITVAEQYPRGLGPTIASLRALALPDEIHEKEHFSCLGDPALAARLAAVARAAPNVQFVVCGLETHVCVLQTALGLLRRGQVYVVTDASGSRTDASAICARSRMADQGVVPVTTEMVLFEWLERAGTDMFRELAPLVR